MFRVPKYNYQDQLPGLDEEILPALRRILLSGTYVLGPEVAEFEANLAAFLEARYAVGVNSGTDALILGLDALGIGPGDRVVTVANSFHATAQAIVRRGARPVLVDCRDTDYLIDLDQVPAVLDPAARALIIVHLFGQAVDVTAAKDLCDRSGLLLVEDCAQAIGARSRGVRVGSVSDAGCWSFAPAKNLAAAGDGGAVSTPRADVDRQLRLLRHFGQPEQNRHEIVGYNSRLDTLQACLLNVKIKRLDAWNAARVRAAAGYRARLAGLPLTFQAGAGPDEHVYHLFQVRAQSRAVRDGLVKVLREGGVDAVVRYPTPLHLQPAFADLGYRRGAFPVAEALAEQTLCLPIRPDLTADDADHVCGLIAEYFGKS